MNRLLRSWILFLAIASGETAAEELKIVREQLPKLHSVVKGDVIPWIEVGGGLLQAEYVLRPNFGGGAHNVWKPLTPEEQQREDARIQIILEGYGLEFGDGASASYLKGTHILTVVNTREQLEKLEPRIFGMDQHPDRRIAIRTEIYEVPNLLALDLLVEAESIAGRDKKHVREKVLRAVADGDAELVSLISLATSNGLMAGNRSVTDFPVIERRVSSAAAPGRKSVFGIRETGTFLEFEPQVGFEEPVIDASINLVHHPAPPHRDAATATRIYPKSIATKIETRSGECILLGSWKATDAEGEDGRGLTHLVFATVSLQPVLPTQ